MNSKILVAALLLATACSKKEDKTDTIIAVEDHVMDITLRRAEPDLYDIKSEEASVGFAADGYETRLLLAIPDILNLYRSDVILSSIANIEIDIFVSSVNVNPEHIKLAFVGADFTPYATWNSRFSLAEGYDWISQGGDILAIDPATASVGKVDGRTDKILGFNITSQLIDAVTNGMPITGFLLQVEQSEDNASQILPVYTSNSSSAYAPRAILTYSDQEVIIP